MNTDTYTTLCTLRLNANSEVRVALAHLHALVSSGPATRDWQLTDAQAQLDAAMTRYRQARNQVEAYKAARREALRGA